MGLEGKGEMFHIKPGSQNFQALSKATEATLLLRAELVVLVHCSVQSCTFQRIIKLDFRILMEESLISPKSSVPVVSEAG